MGKSNDRRMRMIVRVQRLSDKDASERPLPKILKMAQGPQGAFRAALALGLVAHRALSALAEIASTEESAAAYVAVHEMNRIYRLFRDVEGDRS